MKIYAERTICHCITERYCTVAHLIFRIGIELIIVKVGFYSDYRYYIGQYCVSTDIKCCLRYIRTVLFSTVRMYRRQHICSVLLTFKLLHFPGDLVLLACKYATGHTIQ